MKQVILTALVIVVTAAQAQGTNPNSHRVQGYGLSRLIPGSASAASRGRDPVPIAPAPLYSTRLTSYRKSN
jgi:hypothetical protein